MSSTVVLAVSPAVSLTALALKFFGAQPMRGGADLILWKDP